MKKYDFKAIEAKWQKRWQDTDIYAVDLKNAKKPFYNLMMFPYPSAEGLHVGHFFSFGGIDAFGRFKRMQEYDVFQPIGLDAFGINSENYAIKTNTHPMTLSERTEKNFYRQLHATGNAYTWSHTLETNKPDYYKWTQWLFIQLYNQGLVEKKKAPVNWCPSCLTVLSDEQVIAGKCERCSSVVEIKELEQWFFKITNYAERLLKNLEWIDWDESVKTMQKNWIGKKEGAEIVFPVENSSKSINVFTTRADTVFGVTALVIAPEHAFVDALSTKENKSAVKAYVAASQNKSEIERTENLKVKTGVKTGSFAIHPLTKERIPIYIADYVIGSYGSGAVMVVPAHDQRDYEFAKQFGLQIKLVVKTKTGINEKTDKKNAHKVASILSEAVTDYGIVINSGKYNDLTSEEAREKIVADLERKKLGKKMISYHLRDWLISRQRYWGPPIPMIYCNTCGTKPVPIDQLPVVLPYIEEFRPTGTGKSPLASYPEFYETTCPACGGPATRETDVSDTFLDSSWYFLRYPTPDNHAEPFDNAIVKKWLPVASYIGGKEHTVLHLLYSRFMTMVLHDLGFVPFEEPFQQFRAHGMIIKDGAKMSKSRGNVINPDEYIETYGIDVLRLYLAFVGPFGQGGDFRDSGIAGMQRYAARVWTLLQEKNADATSSIEEQRKLNKAIKKVTNDIENLRFNTAIATIMELTNFLADQKTISHHAKQTILQLIAPFAPHLAEELWEVIGQSYSIHTSSWPTYNEEAAKDAFITIVVQINGKTRSTVSAPAKSGEQNIIELAQNDKKIAKYLAGKIIQNIVYIPEKLVNFVIA